MEANVIRSYLVGLGFDVDVSGEKQFDRAIDQAGRKVTGLTTGMTADFLKWQLGITGVFVSVTAAVLGAADKAASADQEYRLLGERMFMTSNQAKGMKIALDALGEPLEAVAWDPELHARYTQLIHDQERLQGMLGPDYAAQMKGIRDMHFELTRIEVVAEYLGSKAISNIFKALGFGDGTAADQMKAITEWLITNTPRLADELSGTLVPALKDTWGIVKDSVGVVGELADMFIYLVGVLSGDTSLQKNTADFHDFATAVGDVIKFMAELLHLTLLTEKATVGLAQAIIHGLKEHKMPDFTQHVGKDGKITFDIWGDGNKGGGSDFWNKFMEDNQGKGLDYNRGGSAAPSAGGPMADQARALAAKVSASTGIPADILWAQWAHETGNFTNRGSRTLNNLAGIQLPGSREYQKFDTLDDFAARYSQILGYHKYSDAKGARDVDAFASGLKKGGYFEGKLSDYEADMKRYLPQYAGGGGGTHITVGDINIGGTNATPDQVHHAVLNAVQAAADKQVQRNLAELGGSYQ